MENIVDKNLITELNKLMWELMQSSTQENVNYKDIIGKAFTLGYNYRNDELKTNILKLFENGK